MRLRWLVEMDEAGPVVGSNVVDPSRGEAVVELFDRALAEADEEGASGAEVQVCSRASAESNAFT